MILGAALLGAQSGNELFQQALMKERSQGDLAGAIKLYEQIVKQHSKDRQLAARALLQMAGCQERLGGEAARRTYERLVKEFGDQSEAVAQARTRIAALNPTLASPSGPRTRQLWAGPGVDNLGSVSPDGRWLSYAHWDTGDLGLRDLVNNTTKLVTNTGGWDKQPQQFAEESLFSPDGKLIAYNWDTDLKDKGHEIRVMNADGTNVRVLCEKPGWLIAQAWSKDGKLLGVTHYDRQGRQSVYIVSVATGEMRELIAPGDHLVEKLSFSPDAKLLAVEMSPVRSKNKDIYVIPVAGGTMTQVVENPAEDLHPVWSPDGRRLRFLSNRNGAFGIWEIPVENGKVGGPEKLLKGDLGSRVQGIGFTDAGSFVYSVNHGGQDVYEVDYDPATGKATSQPRLLSHKVPGQNAAPCYSPDGKRIAWIRPLFGNRSAMLVVRDLATGEERLSPPIPMWSRALQWFPNGERILAEMRADEPDSKEIISFEPATGKLTTILRVHPSRNPLSPVLGKDGKMLYYLFREWPKEEFQFVAYNLETKQSKVLHSTNKTVRGMDLTPDGEHLGYIEFFDSTSSRFKLLPISGGAPRELAKLSRSHAPGITFTPDGKSAVVYSRRYTTEKIDYTKNSLLRVDLESGVLSDVGVTTAGQLWSPTMHPSGRKLAFQSNVNALEIWIAENFLPAGK
jgi:Tol biopolymer transport system component